MATADVTVDLHVSVSPVFTQLRDASRLVADAILLERAACVLERRGGARAHAHQQYLERRAEGFREDADTIMREICEQSGR